MQYRAVIWFVLKTFWSVVNMFIFRMVYGDAPKIHITYARVKIHALLLNLNVKFYSAIKHVN